MADHGLPAPRWFRLARLGRPDGVGAVPEPGDELRWYQHLLEVLGRLPDQERVDTTPDVVESLTRHDAWHPWSLGPWAVPLLVRLGATAEQVLWRPREWPVPVAAEERARYHDEFLAAVEERGRGFAAEIVGVAEGDPLALRGAIDLVELLIVHHDLPLPTAREYWEEWWSRGATPRVGCRWQEQFLAACTVRDAMAPFTADSGERITEVTEAAAEVRAVEQIEDGALAGALLSVWERGERVSSQRAVVQWFQALALVDRLRAERSRLIAALPLVEGTAATFVTELLLDQELTAAELAELAVITLPRGPRPLVGKVLTALGEGGSVPVEVRESVAVLAEGADPRISRKARELLETWAGLG